MFVTKYINTLLCCISGQVKVLEASAISCDDGAATRDITEGVAHPQDGPDEESKRTVMVAGT